MSSTPIKPIELQAVSALASSQAPLEPAHQAVVDERKADRGVGRPSKRPTRDALIEIQHSRMKKLQGHVLDRIEEAVLDKEDPLHALAVEKMLMRVAPVAFWESLSKQEFATDDKAKLAPSITIVINGNAGIEQPAIDVPSREVE